MKRSKSSSRWLQEHENDVYVQKARAEGHRSRAAYKLIELQEKEKLIKSGMRVVDLGAAPGAWSVLARDWVGSKGQVIALDILPMEEIAGVSFIQGDFQEEVVLNQLRTLVNSQPVDVVICDLAPNMSGNKSIDQPRSMYLVELALEFAEENLVEDGAFICKVFHGEGCEAWLAKIKQCFKKIAIRKPKASRARSAETYLVARGFKR